MSAKVRVLFVDNKLPVIADWQEILQLNQYEVIPFHVQNQHWLADCLIKAKTFRPHIVVTDMRLEDDDWADDTSGLDLLQQLKKSCAIVPVVVYSAYLNAITARRVAELNGTFVSKGDDPEELLAVLEALASTVSAVASAKFQNPWPDHWSQDDLITYLLPVSAAQSDIELTGVLDDLLLQSYSNQEDIVVYAPQVDVDAQPMLSMHARALVTATSTQSGYSRHIIRITNDQAVDTESDNYHKYVQLELSDALHTTLTNHHVFWDLGISIYRLEHHNGSRLQSLWDYFQQEPTPDQCIALLRQHIAAWREHSELPSTTKQCLFVWMRKTLKLDTAVVQQILTSFDFPSTWPCLPSDFNTRMAQFNRGGPKQHQSATTHGSFHSENLFTDGKELWVINFEKSGPGPLYRDLCALEIDFVLRAASTLADDWAAFELMVTLLNLGLTNAPVIPNTVDPKMIAYVAALRMLADEMSERFSSLEYFGTLLFQALEFILLPTPPTPLGMRRYAYLYATLLYERCSKLETPLYVPYPIHYAEDTDLGWSRNEPEVHWRGGNGEGVLEKIHSQRAEFYDIGFLQRGIVIARAVGCIELNNGKARGTGFLVGPDLLLTNHHVVRDIEDITALAVRFGYHIDMHGKLIAGKSFACVEVVAQSDSNNLDYTLVRLNGEPGNDPTIGYLKPTAKTLVKESPFFIIQYPLGQPQKIVLQDNWVTYVAADHQRVQYMTNTQNGSSGAPVCDAQWDVVALHHSSAAWPKRSASVGIVGNEGIPMKAILPEIAHFLPGGRK